MTIFHLQCGAPNKRRQPAAALSLSPGDKVMRKSDRDSRLAVGTVIWVRDGRARIRWPAPQRIGGEFHHSTVKLNNRDLMVATDLTIAERRVDVRLARLKSEMGALTVYGPCDGDGPYEKRITRRMHLRLEAAREVEWLKATA